MTYEVYGEMMEDLINSVKPEIAKGLCGPDVDGNAVGQMIDMIKDLASAKKDCMEACYYASVVAAMNKGGNGQNWDSEWDENPMSILMGYNPNRSANGRYASSGGDRTTGKSGFHEGMMPQISRDFLDQAYLHDPNFERRIREIAGYSGRNGEMDMRDPRRNGSRMNMMGYDDGMQTEHGKTFDDYQMAKRNYSTTKSSADKDAADKRAIVYVGSTLNNFREMWNESDPALRKRMKEEFDSLMDDIG